MCKEFNLVSRVQFRLSKHMIELTLLSIFSGIFFGYFTGVKLGFLILPLVFAMIYPMMTSISLSALRNVRGCFSVIVEALVLNFAIAPAYMFVLTSIFVPDPRIRLGLMFLAIAPSSSMGLGFIGLSGGDLLAGAATVALAFLCSIFVYPLLGGYIAEKSSFHVPYFLMVKSLIFVLILPLALGVLTREAIVRKRGVHYFNRRYKPVFSTITLVCLYAMIFVIFSSKARMIVHDLRDILMVAPVAICFYPSLVLLTLLINRKRLSYEKHQSVVFTSVSKNIALSIAILVAVFGKEGQYFAVAPALMAVFQAPFLMCYLRMQERVRSFFGSSEIDYPKID